jgi:hypothetical protein
MRSIDIYLAHRNSIKFIKQQVTLIRKFFKCSETSTITLYGYVDGTDDTIKTVIKNEWEKYNVIPIDIPNLIDGYNRNTISPTESYGLAFTYVYNTYILKNNHISVCIENDIFPFKPIDIEHYVENVEICGEVRFNAADLPDRMVMFWLGFIIFNGELMQDRNLFSGLSNPVRCIESGNFHSIDCGGQSYYWIKKDQRNIRQMVTKGNENYDGFTSLTCNPHNITHDIEHLPDIFRENYQPSYRALIYDNCLIHLEQMGKQNYVDKQHWWDNCYNKLMNPDEKYISLGFQCTTAELLKKMNKKTESFPFDWILSNPNSVAKLMDRLMTTDNIEQFVIHHFLRCDTFIEFIKPEEFKTNTGNILFNTNYKLIFPHDVLNRETIQKYTRRFERFKFYIKSHSMVKFVFINRIANNITMNFTIDGENQLDNLYVDLNLLYDTLCKYMPCLNFHLYVINAVDKLNQPSCLNKQIILTELIPSNGTSLTDEEIIAGISI